MCTSVSLRDNHPILNDTNPKGFVKIPIHALYLGELLQKAN